MLYAQFKANSFNSSDLPYCVMVPVYFSFRLKRQRSHVNIFSAKLLTPAPSNKIDNKCSALNALRQHIIRLDDLKTSILSQTNV